MTQISIRGLSQDLDRDFVSDQLRAESARLGTFIDITWYADVADLYKLSEDPSGPVIYLTTPETPDLTDLVHPHASRCDVGTRAFDRSPCLDLHIQGRGVGGILWATRAAYHRAKSPPTVISYGDAPEQFGELRIPAPTCTAPPVAVLIHGGYWRPHWQLDLMDSLARDLLATGIATWNIEYRSGEENNPEAMTQDVRAAVEQIVDSGPSSGIDPKRLAIIGHSAGAQLAAWVSTELHQPPTLAVLLAGVLDLAQAADRGMSNGAVPRALGGFPHSQPARYRAFSPLALLPLGVAQLVVSPLNDDPDLIEIATRYCARAAELGDLIEHISDNGDHFSAIDPTSQLWHATASAIIQYLTPKEASHDTK